jgi:hypothetical protein
MQERPSETLALEEGVQLANAEPQPWNPIRTYLGARNVVRLLRTYATPRQQAEFVVALARSLPLEFLAAVLGREGWLRLGRWSYADTIRYYFRDRHPTLRGAPSGALDRVRRAVVMAALAPIGLCWSFPRDVWRAVRTGRTASVGADARGLWDGLLDRPVPFRELGLR